MRKIFTHLWIVIVTATVIYVLLDIIREFGVMSLIKGATPVLVMVLCAFSFLFWVKDKYDAIEDDESEERNETNHI